MDKTIRKTESNYEFRTWLDKIHKTGRRDHGLKPARNELEISEGWTIGVVEGCSKVVLQAAQDLRDFFQASMDLSLRLLRKKVDALAKEDNCIVLCEKSEIPRLSKGLTKPRSYRIAVRTGRVTVCGFDDRGGAQGSYHIEDLMNLREAPFLTIGETKRESLFSPRMTHSGWGIDQFPDSHLNSIAHAGMDALLLFVKGVDLTTRGYLDFNDLIRRAKTFGVDVYFYNYLKCWKHPDDDDAEEAFDKTFGSLFKACPDAKGIVLVGESCEFPSKDERTTRRSCHESVVDGIPSTKPSPGWWPCDDYPRWVGMIKKVVRKWSPEADIVFWTYNWGYAPEKDRIKLINALPTDISLQVTFEMFDRIRRENTVSSVMDYTISHPGPGTYFTSEAKAAHKRGITLYTMCNTGGRTWDFGLAPYEPFPLQWGKRHDALNNARRKWGLSGLMESHHYGFHPSFISEFAKWNFWTPSPSHDEILKRIAVRDFGPAGAGHALTAWKYWSKSIGHYIPSNEDQYGPNRVGPSYPLIFHPDITRTFGGKEIAMSSAPYAHFPGSAIVKTFYHPYENVQQSPGSFRVDVEIRSYRKARELMEKGLVEIRKAIKLAPARTQAEAIRQELLGQFISNTLATTINVKRWWKLNQELLVARDRKKAHATLDGLVEIANAEISNAEATIPLVEQDSSLGWEPSMEYLCDKPHLEWKIRQTRNMLDNELALYRTCVDL